jgi:hypothetical protein
MCAQDLKATADEKRQEKEVEEMRGPQPQWIIKSHHQCRAEHTSPFSVAISFLFVSKKRSQNGS